MFARDQLLVVGHTGIVVHAGYVDSLPIRLNHDGNFQLTSSVGTNTFNTQKTVDHAGMLSAHTQMPNIHS